MMANYLKNKAMQTQNNDQQTEVIRQQAEAASEELAAAIQKYQETMKNLGAEKIDFHDDCTFLVIPGIDNYYPLP